MNSSKYVDNHMNKGAKKSLSILAIAKKADEKNIYALAYGNRIWNKNMDIHVFDSDLKKTKHALTVHNVTEKMDPLNTHFKILPDSKTFVVASETMIYIGVLDNEKNSTQININDDSDTTRKITQLFIHGVNIHVVYKTGTTTAMNIYKQERLTERETAWVCIENINLLHGTKIFKYDADIMICDAEFNIRKCVRSFKDTESKSDEYKYIVEYKWDMVVNIKPAFRDEFQIRTADQIHLFKHGKYLNIISGKFTTVINLTSLSSTNIDFEVYAPEKQKIYKSVYIEGTTMFMAETNTIDIYKMHDENKYDYEHFKYLNYLDFDGPVVDFMAMGDNYYVLAGGNIYSIASVDENLSDAKPRNTNMKPSIVLDDGGDIPAAKVENKTIKENIIYPSLVNIPMPSAPPQSIECDIVHQTAPKMPIMAQLDDFMAALAIIYKRYRDQKTNFYKVLSAYDENTIAEFRALLDKTFINNNVHLIEKVEFNAYKKCSDVEIIRDVMDEVTKFTNKEKCSPFYGSEYYISLLERNCDAEEIKKEREFLGLNTDDFIPRNATIEVENEAHLIKYRKNGWIYTTVKISETADQETAKKASFKLATTIMNSNLIK